MPDGRGTTQTKGQRVRLEDFGFRKPAVLKGESSGLRSFMHSARKREEDGIVLREDSVRRLWAGVFANNTLAECADCVQILRDEVDMGLTMGSKKFIVRANPGWDFAPPEDGVAETLKDKRKSPLLRFKKNQSMVIVNMVGGMPAAPLVIESLTKLNRKPADYALVGYSRNGDTYLENGYRMYGEFFLPQRELQVLVRHKDKTALIIDDTHVIGESFTAIMKSLRKIGYSKFYKLVTGDGTLLDERLKEL